MGGIIRSTRAGGHPTHCVVPEEFYYSLYKEVACRFQITEEGIKVPGLIGITTVYWDTVTDGFIYQEDTMVLCVREEGDYTTWDYIFGCAAPGYCVRLLGLDS